MQPLRGSMSLRAACLVLLASLAATEGAGQVPSFATGVKVGEVSSDCALVWARLCSVDAADPTSVDAAAPGAPGSVTIRYWPKGEEEQAVKLDSMPVDAERDHTIQIPLTGLAPQTSYEALLTAYGIGGEEGETVAIRFRTAPGREEPVPITAVIVTCQGHETVDDPVRGHWIYKQMLTHDPDFFIHTGDVVYYDKGKAQPLSQTVAAARQRWNRMFSYEWNQAFHMQVSSCFMKDDHDTLKNDCWPGQTYGEISWEEGLALFREQTPQGPLPYRRVRWGKDLECWLIEGRDYRSPNTKADGLEKTILGLVQKAWLKETLKESDATFKLVVFPSPVVGPDMRKGKRDNHSNPEFAHEGKELREYLASVPNTYVVCGDRHWQYASKDPETGLIEIGCGPVNNAHADIGANAAHDKSYHLYYGGGKGGYLKVSVRRESGAPRIDFTWHGDQTSAGAVNHRLSFPADKPIATTDVE